MDSIAPMQTILVIDDDESLRDTIGVMLEQEGFRAVLVADGRAGYEKSLLLKPDLILVDLRLPGMSGVEICKQVRAAHVVTPIIVLSALGDEIDKVLLLEIGADDYVVKPFGTRELLARIRAVLRRAGGDAREQRIEPGVRALMFAGWTLEPARRRLLNPDGVEVALTGGEYDLLIALVERAKRVLTRDMLLDLLRGRQAGPFDRAIDVAISRLRRKLEDHSRNSQLIKTVRGGGYVFAVDVERV